MADRLAVLERQLGEVRAVGREHQRRSAERARATPRDPAPPADRVAQRRSVERTDQPDDDRRRDHEPQCREDRQPPPPPALAAIRDDDLHAASCRPREQRHLVRRPDHARARTERRRDRRPRPTPVTKTSRRARRLDPREQRRAIGGVRPREVRLGHSIRRGRGATREQRRRVRLIGDRLGASRCASSQIVARNSFDGAAIIGSVFAERPGIAADVVAHHRLIERRQLVRGIADRLRCRRPRCPRRRARVATSTPSSTVSTTSTVGRAAGELLARPRERLGRSTSSRARELLLVARTAHRHERIARADLRGIDAAASRTVRTAPA